MHHLHVQMFGDFTLRDGEALISDNQNRTKKIWLLMAYILYNRGQIVSRKELINLLWRNDSTSSNPENALKITFHRVRTLLDQLGESFGHKLVIWQDNGYKWNMEIPMDLDIHTFDLLYHQKYNSDDSKLNGYLNALQLYRGHFLSNLSKDEWVQHLANDYYRKYMDMVTFAAPRLVEKDMHAEAISVAKHALTFEPTNESLTLLLMKEYMTTGDTASALSLYEFYRKRLMAEQNKKPCQELFQLHRSILQTVTDKSLSMNGIIGYLEEESTLPGALKCDYDYFKILYQAERRASERNGKPGHLALFTVSGKNKKILSQKSLDLTMDQLSEEIRLGLRRGDVYAKCSIRQYVVLLKEANYENSAMVCERIIHSFMKAHPHSWAAVDFEVQLLFE